MEDRHSSFTLGANGVLVGVFDGHSGTETSTVASAFLSGYIARELGAADESEDNIASALKNAYVAFDHDLTDTVPELAIKVWIR